MRNDTMKIELLVVPGGERSDEPRHAVPHAGVHPAPHPALVRVGGVLADAQPT
ncbi:hypothetical protein [Streptomyces sp. NPDC002785]|uniref:hypothetical protein n=1 Tax=Streptomyces sp. NPDC002785 TaxID=3154543 RepID=UPI00332A5C14